MSCKTFKITIIYKQIYLLTQQYKNTQTYLFNNFFPNTHTFANIQPYSHHMLKGHKAYGKCLYNNYIKAPVYHFMYNYNNKNNNSQRNKQKMQVVAYKSTITRIHVHKHV